MIRDMTVQCHDEICRLAPYAVKNSESRGRRIPEERHPFRTDFQRDRDRILHSKAFRRLENKTQVFLSGTGDHLRTRLTHTIEVSAIARTIARSLYLNEDLAETISLAHDLGHTPFGHAGERALSRIMEDHGGFDHNLQALRVVDLLEIKYPEYDGLNLTREVRAGLVKHRENGVLLDGVPLPLNPSLEAQTADLADDLTYYGHDVDDGLESGLITLEMLKEVPLWNMAAEMAEACGLKPDDERYKAFAIRSLINMMVGNAIHYSDSILSREKPASSDDVRNAGFKMIAFDPDFEKQTIELRDFLYHNLYFHPELTKLNEFSLHRMSVLFNAYVKHPDLLGATARARIEEDGIYLAAADYIAGMTDVFAGKAYGAVSFLFGNELHNSLKLEDIRI